MLPELRSWVSAVWWCQGAADAESVLPAGRAHLVLPLDGGWHAGVLHGPASRPRLVEPVPEQSAIGVVFRPGGLRLDETLPQRYSHLIFVCGPVHGQQVAGLHGRFPGSRRIAIGVTVIDPATNFTSAAGMIGAAVRQAGRTATQSGAAERLAQLARTALSDDEAVDAVRRALEEMLT